MFTNFWQNYVLTDFPILGNQFIQAGIILLIFVFGSKILTLILERYIVRLTAKTKTNIDDKLIAAAKGPITLFIIVIGLKSALLPLDLVLNISSALQKVFSSIIVLILAHMLISFISIVISAWGKKVSSKTASDLDDQLVNLFTKSVKVVGYILAVLFILQIWGIQVGPLLATLGVGGIAIAFALQNSLGNIFGGISLILDKTVKVGDRIELDDGTVGNVTDVGLRSTRIRTYNNEIVVIPNGKLAEMKIRNFVFVNSVDTSVRTAILFGVEYGSDIKQVQATVINALKQHPDVLHNPEPSCSFEKMGDFALEMKAFYWVSDISLRDASKSLANTLIYEALSNARIGIPFPTRTVYLKNPE